MEEVKIFTGATCGTAQMLQDEINAWMKRNQGIEIVDRLCSVTDAPGGRMIIVVTLFYKR